MAGLLQSPSGGVGVEVDENEVAEVRCSESGVPLPTIPSWYANVRVKFISEAVRQKSQRTMILPASLAEVDRRTAVVADGDEDADAAEPALDDEVVDDLVIDIEGDAEADADPDLPDEEV